MLALGVFGIPFYLTVRAHRRRPTVLPAQTETAMEAA
jgi:hypothetical protein